MLLPAVGCEYDARNGVRFVLRVPQHERMVTIERIVQAENPNWRSIGQDPIETLLEDRTDRISEIGSRSNRPSRRT